MILRDNLTTVRREDLKRLEDIAIEQLKKGFTCEEAHQALMRAGILDENENFTEPYKNLGKAGKRLSGK